MTPANIRRLEHAAKTIDECIDAIMDECPDLIARAVLVANLRLAAEKIRVTLASEDGDSLVADLALASEPCAKCSGSGWMPSRTGTHVELCDLCPGVGEETDAQISAKMLAAFEPFRVLGSCPAPQVDVIDGETA